LGLRLCVKNTIGKHDQKLRRKGGPVKPAPARRLRQEMPMPLQWICHRLQGVPGNPSISGFMTGDIQNVDL
jgi:hypothetical protein